MRKIIVGVQKMADWQCNEDAGCFLGFSMRDKYCGLCKRELRTLRSSLQPLGQKTSLGVKRVLVYPSMGEDSSDYVVPVTMDFGSSDGKIIRNAAVEVDWGTFEWDTSDENGQTTEEASEGENGDGGLLDLEEPGEVILDVEDDLELKQDEQNLPVAVHPREREVKIVQERERTICVLPVDRQDEIPKEGRPGTLRLYGAFGAEAIPLRVCKLPSFEIRENPRWEGNQYISSVGRDGGRKNTAVIDVWRKRELTLELHVHALSAPVLCSHSAVMKHAAPGIHALEAKWESLEPSRPGVLRFRIDPSDWEENEQHNAEVILPLHGVLDSDGNPWQELFEITFQWVDKGDLKFDPEVIHVRQLYRGQRLRLKTSVSNEGRQSIGPVNVRSDVDWITVSRNSGYIEQIDGLEEDAHDPQDPADTTDPSAASQQGLSVPHSSQHEISFVIDTDRVKASEKPPLLGSVTIHELRSDPRVWHVPVSIDRLVELDPLREVLAIDLGSANTCAAYAEWDDVDDGHVNFRTLPLESRASKGVKWSMDFIPSALYFYSVRDRNNPEVTLGEKALTAATIPSGIKAVEAPDDRALCGLVQDAKRWIGTHELSYTIVDREGKVARYSADEIVRLTLREIINRARQTRSIQKVELCYPTKFTAEQVRAYRTIIKSLDGEFSALGIRVQLNHPNQLRLDEASAAAISFIYDGSQQEDAEDHQLLVCADWGGGTFDDCVLELERVKDDPSGRFRSEYRGLGGDARLGGNDVTCAMMTLLRDCIVEGINGILKRLYDDKKLPQDTIKGIELPVTWEGNLDDEPSREGKQNYHVLWAIAERLKIYLTVKGSSTGESSLARSAILFMEDRSALVAYLNVLSLRFVYTGKKGRGRVRRKIGELQGNLDALEVDLRDAAIAEIMRIELPDVYDLPLVHQRTEETIRTRLTRRIKRVRRLVDNIWIDEQDNRDSNGRLNRKRLIDTLNVEQKQVLVAGAASRLPLLSELLEAEFGDFQINLKPELAKQRVSYGLAFYSGIAKIQRFFRDFAKPTEVLPDVLGIMTVQRGVKHFHGIIPAGTRWTRKEGESGKGWFEFEVRMEDVHQSNIRDRDGVPRESPRGYPLFGGSSGELVGVFDLTQPVGTGEFRAIPPPRPESKSWDDMIGKGWLRLDGPGKIQLRLELDGNEYGWFDLHWVEGADLH